MNNKVKKSLLGIEGSMYNPIFIQDLRREFKVGEDGEIVYILNFAYGFERVIIRFDSKERRDQVFDLVLDAFQTLDINIIIVS